MEFEKKNPWDTGVKFGFWPSHNSCYEVPLCRLSHNNQWHCRGPLGAVARGGVMSCYELL